MKWYWKIVFEIIGGSISIFGLWAIAVLTLGDEVPRWGYILAFILGSAITEARIDARKWAGLDK